MHEKAIHLTQLIHEKFKVDLDVSKVEHFYDSICHRLKTQYSLTTTEDLTKEHLDDLLKLYQLRVPPKRRRKSVVNGNGDKLKIAFWFIDKVGGTEIAKRVFDAAVTAHERLAT